MFCPKCGANLPDNARFCTTCGTLLDKQNGQQENVGSDNQKAQPGPVKPETAPQPKPDATSQSKQEEKPARRPSLLLVASICVALAAVVVLGISFMVGNTEPDSGKAVPKKLDDGSWTVLIYLCGSNLETEDGYASKNLEELTQLSLPQSVHMLVETGGSNEWHNEKVDAEHLNRFCVENGELALKDQQPRASMGDANTLRDFLRWGMDSYPAEHYALMFWDHGGGSLTGVCLDEMDDDGLTLPEMNQALKESESHFDVVGFDTCLMATLETAQMLSRHADYMVASEEVEPSNGWAYSVWPEWFANAQNTDDVLGFCENVASSYVKRCEEDDVDDAVTVSIVDLSSIDGLAKAFEKAAEGLARSTEKSASLQRVIVHGRDVQSFGYANYWEGYTNMVDLGDLMVCIKDELADESKPVLDALEKAVVYESHGSARAKATGLSVYYPLAVDKDAYEAYRMMSEDLGLGNDAYVQYLSVRTGVYDSSEWKDKGIRDLKPLQASDAIGAFTCKGAVDQRGAFSVHITGNTEFVQVATYQFGQVQPDGTVVPLGSGNNLDLQIDEHGQLTYTDQFAGGVLNIGGKYAYAELVDMVAENGKPKYNLYSVPVELTRTLDAGRQVTVEENLLIMYLYDTDSYELLCYYEDVDDSGMAGKSIIQLKKGDQLKFLVAREVDGKIQSGNTGTITLDASTKVEELNPGDATYVYQIVVTDIFGRSYDPVSAKITFKDGKRTAELL